ncbi:MAG: helix-turn-helix domain-containing protein [Chloroflexota bacterium]
MPNVATVLKSEISRLARKEVRGSIEGLRKASAQSQKSIAELKRRLSELERKLAAVEKAVSRDIPSEASEQAAAAGKFFAKGLHSHRKRLKLSATEYGQLIGVTGQTVYRWEHRKGRPRQHQMASLLEIRRIGRREAKVRLERLSQDTKKKR